MTAALGVAALTTGAAGLAVTAALGSVAALETGAASLAVSAALGDSEPGSRVANNGTSCTQSPEGRWLHDEDTSCAGFITGMSPTRCEQVAHEQNKTWNDKVKHPGWPTGCWYHSDPSLQFRFNTDTQRENNCCASFDPHPGVARNLDIYYLSQRVCVEKHGACEEDYDASLDVVYVASRTELICGVNKTVYEYPTGCAAANGGTSCAESPEGRYLLNTDVNCGTHVPTGVPTASPTASSAPTGASSNPCFRGDVPFSVLRGERVVTVRARELAVGDVVVGANRTSAVRRVGRWERPGANGCVVPRGYCGASGASNDAIVVSYNHAVRCAHWEANVWGFCEAHWARAPVETFYHVQLGSYWEDDLLIPGMGGLLAQSWTGKDTKPVGEPVGEPVGGGGDRAVWVLAGLKGGARFVRARAQTM